MRSLKSEFQAIKITSRLQVAGIITLILLAFLLLWFNSGNSGQPERALFAQVKFAGEYRIGDGEWQSYVEGRHIPATKGDVTLRGKFQQFTPEGEYVGVYDLDLPLAFYTDHINLMIYEGENDPYIIDIENPLFGYTLCGEGWTAYSITGDSTQTIEIVVHNPHRFGNETAVDELLSNVCIWAGMDFESDILESGKNQRNIGMMFIIVSAFLLGAALFSLLLRTRNSQIICTIGATFLFAGLYFEYSAPGVSVWGNTIASNTSILGFSMILYMLFICCNITYCLQETKKIGVIATFAMGILDGLYFTLPILSKGYFYDTWIFWVVTQTFVNLVLLGCLIKESKATANKVPLWVRFLSGLVLIAFEVDAAAHFQGWWNGGLVSKYIFFALFFAGLFVILRIIPESINAAEKAKEMEQQKLRLEIEKSIVEAELKESRVSIMLSQIQPHFIYNTLGTIERMCLKDPEKAVYLVRNFSLYLRGNFSELDSVTPIRFAEELKHIEHYVNIEKFRFPDMNIEYNLETTDFVLPALSVQPLVENAIKHGLMRLETGGTVMIHSYETPTHFCVEVKDDGVGFDTNMPVDGKKHVGLRNIRGRLQAMVNGELIIESRVNSGTKAVVMIPKEVSA